jgi:molecular chaperone HscA
MLASVAALEADGARLLDDTERAAIVAALDALREALGAGEVDAIREAMDALDAATAEFAARRMDAAVHGALAGQHLSTLS